MSKYFVTKRDEKENVVAIVDVKNIKFIFLKREKENQLQVGGRLTAGWTLLKRAHAKKIRIFNNLIPDNVNKLAKLTM